MRVMEAEFAFRMKRDVLRNDATPLSTAEVMDEGGCTWPSNSRLALHRV